MTRPSLKRLSYLLLLASLGCGRIVAVTFPGDPNVGDQYFCKVGAQDAAGSRTVTCKSGTKFFSADENVDLTTSAANAKCEKRIHKIWLDTNEAGDVSRLQYQCDSGLFLCEKQLADAGGSKTYSCASGDKDLSSAQEVDLGAATEVAQCKNHIQKLWIDTKSNGDVVGIQYQCAVDAVIGLPK